MRTQTSPPGTSWTRKRLGEWLPIRYGKARSVAHGYVREDTPVYGSSGEIGRYTRALTSGPSLIVGRKGNVGAAHYSSEPCWPIDTVFYAEEPPGKDLRLFKYLLDFLQLVSLDRSTAVPGLRRNDYNEIEVALPESAEEQHRIVEEIEKQLTRLDAGVAALKRVQANLRRYRAAVLKAACEGRLVPTEAELARQESRPYEPASILVTRIKADRANVAPANRRGSQRESVATFPVGLSPLPEGWAWTTVGQIAEVVRGASPRPAGDPRFFGGGIPWITVGPITADNDPFLWAVPATVTPAGRKRSRYVEAGTLLLTNSGATLGVPKITLIGGCINDGVAALLGLDHPLKLFLLYYLRSLTERLRGINQGAAQPNLNTTIIKAIGAPLPPLSEQHRIVAEVERHLSLADGLERIVTANLHRATRLRQSVLQAAFSGSLVPNAAKAGAKWSGEEGS